MVDVKRWTLVDALSADRVDWARIAAEGWSIDQIAIEAGVAGDQELVRRAQRAMSRRRRRA